MNKNIQLLLLASASQIFYSCGVTSTSESPNAPIIVEALPLASPSLNAEDSYFYNDPIESGNPRCRNGTTASAYTSDMRNWSCQSRLLADLTFTFETSDSTKETLLPYALKMEFIDHNSSILHSEMLRANVDFLFTQAPDTISDDLSLFALLSPDSIGEDPVHFIPETTFRYEIPPVVYGSPSAATLTSSGGQIEETNLRIRFQSFYYDGGTNPLRNGETKEAAIEPSGALNPCEVMTYFNWRFLPACVYNSLQSDGAPAN